MCRNSVHVTPKGRWRNIFDSNQLQLWWSLRVILESAFWSSLHCNMIKMVQMYLVVHCATWCTFISGCSHDRAIQLVSTMTRRTLDEDVAFSLHFLLRLDDLNLTYPRKWRSPSKKSVQYVKSCPFVQSKCGVSHGFTPPWVESKSVEVQGSLRAWIVMDCLPPLKGQRNSRFWKLEGRNSGRSCWASASCLSSHEVRVDSSRSDFSMNPLSLRKQMQR